MIKLFNHKIKLLILALMVSVGLGVVLAPGSHALPNVKCSDNSAPRFDTRRTGSVVYTCAPASAILGSDDGAGGGPNYYDLGVECGEGEIRQSDAADGNPLVAVRCTGTDGIPGGGTITHFNRPPISLRGGGGGGGDDTGDGDGGGSTATSECALPKTRYGIPTWYKYLPGATDPADGTTCRLMVDFSVEDTNSLISVGLAVVEIMLFIGGIVAVAFIVYGGFRYVLSQGNPDQTKTAKDAVLNAVIGLVIAVLASTLVRFIAAELTT